MLFLCTIWNHFMFLGRNVLHTLPTSMWVHHGHSSLSALKHFSFLYFNVCHPPQDHQHKVCQYSTVFILYWRPGSVAEGNFNIKCKHLKFSLLGLSFELQKEAIKTQEPFTSSKILQVPSSPVWSGLPEFKSAILPENFSKSICSNLNHLSRKEWEGEPLSSSNFHFSLFY